MISFAVLVCLLVLSADARRSDCVGSISPTANTHWGDWGPEDWCLKDQFAFGFSLKVEPKQGSGDGDDSAVNGIKLHCRSVCGAKTHDISSSVQKWGTWKRYNCPKHYFLKAVSMKSEEPQGSRGDNSAVNNFEFLCQSSGGNKKKLRGDGMPWGPWSDCVSCPSGSYICGIKTRVQKQQGRGDDTALNEATFYCCKSDAQ